MPNGMLPSPVPCGPAAGYPVPQGLDKETKAVRSAAPGPIIQLDDKSNCTSAYPSQRETSALWRIYIKATQARLLPWTQSQQAEVWVNHSGVKVYDGSLCMQMRSPTHPLPHRRQEPLSKGPRGCVKDKDAQKKTGRFHAREPTVMT